MGVSFERVTGWLARIGPAHRKYGDPYSASALVTDQGVVKGFAGHAPPRLIREVIRAAETELKTTLNWERIKPMAEKLFDATIDMEYHEQGGGPTKARLHIEYFGLDQAKVDGIEGATLGGLLGLRQNQE